jgi:adenylate kinase family enzyme
LNEVLSKDTWIIDGNYISTMELRIQKCDTIVFLDYPVDICLDGIKARLGNKRSDMPWIENEIDQEFIKYIERYNLDVRPNVLELLNKYSDKNIYIFKNRNESNEFLNVFNR